MENQNQPPFPFDAFDAPFDIPDDFGAADIFPTSIPATAGDHRAMLQAIRRKLQELDEQLRTLLTMIDRECRDASTVGRAVRPPIDPPSMRSMPNLRPAEPLTVSIPREEADALRTIEGVFDGQNMVGPDGKQYSVPANYSSKSKLVEGDILKLRITPRGAFVYKQIGPIARERRIGVLERDDITGEYVVIVADADGDRSTITRAVVERTDLPAVAYKRYRVLRASVTYYHGAPGDEVVVLVPQGSPATWAAVDNIIKR
jgi:hypothetical protein